MLLIKKISQGVFSSAGDVKTYVNKCWREMGKVTPITGHSRLYHFLDFVYAHFRYGCIIRQYTVGRFFAKRNFERRNMLTYLRILKVMDAMNDPKFIHLLEDKSHFNQHFSQFVRRDWLFCGDSTKEDIETFMRKHKDVIVKPLTECEGHGIHKFSVEGKDEKDIAGKAESLEKNQYIIEEMLKQHDKMVFGNSSINTLRMMTVLDKDGNAHVVKAVLRAGVGESVVDNYNAGGAIYPIDLEGGFIEDCGTSYVGGRVSVHPGTSILMVGYAIPHWKNVVKAVEDAHRLLPECRFIGWDAVVLPSGEIELIEGNHNPDYELYEFIGKTGAYGMIKSAM